MTDPDFANFGEPNRSRPEGYRLTHPREESASESSGALTGFDPGRASLGRPEVPVNWTPADAAPAPEWATGTPAANGHALPFGHSESLISSPDSVAIGRSEFNTPISDSVAIPRQSDTEFSAFVSPYSTDTTQPEYPQHDAPNLPTRTTAPEFRTTTQLTGTDPAAPPRNGDAPHGSFGLPQRSPGLPSRTGAFPPHAANSGSSFDEPAAAAMKPEYAPHTNGSTIPSAESAPFLNDSVLTSPESGRRDTGRLTHHPAPEVASAAAPAQPRPAYSEPPFAEPTPPEVESRRPAEESAFSAPVRTALPTRNPQGRDARLGLTTPAAPDAEPTPGTAANLNGTAQSPSGTAEPAPDTAADVRNTMNAHGTATFEISTNSHAAADTAHDTAESEKQPGLPPRRPRGFVSRAGRRTTEFAVSGTLIAETPSPVDDPPLEQTSTPSHETNASSEQTPPPDTTEPTPTVSNLAAPASRRSAHRRAAQDDAPTTVDVHLIMHLLLSSHTLETVADKAEAGEASLEDFIRAARRTRTAAVDLVTAWFGGPDQMRQFAEALLAASGPT
ncbi:hypothetical protein [Nocardia alni]|uniref:hypothetical protein n=1 Tax=Nocardia alni TaxID=2815723 RepID=UPI001C225920|nr:hypothetical protein [Nocardia alni]